MTAATWSSEALPSIARLYRFQWEAVQNSYVLLFPEGMVQLNGPAGEILRRCDGRRSARELIDELKQVFEGEEIESEVLAFLRTATADGWIEWRQAATT